MRCIGKSLVKDSEVLTKSRVAVNIGRRSYGFGKFSQRDAFTVKFVVFVIKMVQFRDLPLLLIYQ